MKFVRGIAFPSPVVRLALLGISFYIAYRGQGLLETKEDLRLGWILFLVAAVPLWAAWFLGRRQQAAPAQEEAGAEPQTTTKATSGPARALRVVQAVAPLWPLLLLVSLAAALRFYELSSLPVGLNFDEAQNGLAARRILDDPLGYHPVFITLASSNYAGFIYVLAGSMKLLGDGMFALRCTAAVIGILTVPALYLLGRELFDQRIAVLAAFLLAVMRWHLNFSRIAFHGIFATLLMVLALYFLVRGLKGRGWWNFLIAGLLVGIGLQSHYAFFLVPPIIVLYVLHYALSEGRRRLVVVTSGLLLVAVTSALVAVPVLRFLNEDLDTATNRGKAIAITANRDAGETADEFWRSTKIHALMFNVEGDGNGRHNLPPLPMLDRFTAMVFVLGIALALTRPHDSRYFLLLAWLVIMLQPGIWTNEPPSAYRTLMVTPVVALLAALPLGMLADIALRRGGSLLAEARALRLRQHLPVTLARLAAGGGLLFLLFQVAFLNTDTFFNQQLKNPFVWSYFEPLDTIVGKELDRFPPHEISGYASDTLFNTPAVTFLAPDATVLPIVLARDAPFQGEGDVAVFLDGRDQKDSEAFRWLRQMYPEASFSEYHPPGQPQSTLLHELIIRAEMIDAINGVEATYRPGSGGPPVVGRESDVAADWTRETPVPLPFSAQWSASLKIPDTANRGLRVEAPGRIRLTLDRVPPVEGEGWAEVTGDLALGLHSLSVQVEASGPGVVRLLWLTPQGGWYPVPQSAFFLPSIVPHGLTASYHALENLSSPLDLSGPLVQRRVDPYVSYRYHIPPTPAPGPFAVSWVGSVTIPEPGGYRLATDSRDEASLTVDGQPYTGGVGFMEGTLALTAGPHDIELRYAAHGGSYILFYWLAPGENPSRVIVPFESLLPW